MSWSPCTFCPIATVIETCACAQRDRVVPPWTRWARPGGFVYHKEMDCQHAIIIPTIHFQTAKRTKIRNTLSELCVFFFAGITSRVMDRQRTNICELSLHVSNVTTSVTQDYVVLPIVDSYFNLGMKLYHMMRWIQHLNPRVLLYLDMDTAEKMSRARVLRMFHEVEQHTNIISGDIMDCLMPANQLCCCGSSLYYSLTQFYNSTTPYQLFPPMAWGGGGTGFDRIAIHNMMKVHPRIHYSSDHTLSYWARQANVTFHRASWSTMRDKWCPMKVYEINASSWKCRPHSRYTTTFQKINCHPY